MTRRRPGEPMGPEWRRLLPLLIPLCLLLSRLPAQAPAIGEDEVANHVASLKRSILEAQHSGGYWSSGSYSTGMTALAVLALRHAGLPVDHPAIQRGIRYIDETSDGTVYGESLVLCALELADPSSHRGRVESALKFLIRAQNSMGSWSYQGSAYQSYDNSNTQFAVLGLAAAERCGLKVPAATRTRALDHWLRCASPDGGWGYRKADHSTLSMTCAGIASLHLLGRRYEKQGRACGQYEVDQTLQKGLKAMTRLISRGGLDAGNTFSSYMLYALERVGIFLDLKEIEGLDWYRWGAERILSTNDRGEVANQAMDLLFLERGEGQVAIAKWRWKGDWNQDHEDVRNWVARASAELRMKLDWIPADLAEAGTPASKASLVFVNGHERFDAGEADAVFLRQFLGRRGTVVAEACCGRAGFIEGFKAFVKSKLYPGATVTFTPIPAGHPACNQKYALSPEDVGGLLVKIGCQAPRIVILTRDISCALNGEPGAPGEEERARKVALNLLQWAIREKAPKGKLSREPPQAESGEPVLPGEESMPVEPAGKARQLRQPFGRLVHRGEWEVDLAFFPTLARSLAVRKDLPRFDGEVFVKPTSRDLFSCPLLFVTGHGDPALRKEEWRPLRTYLELGGTIVASSCCRFEEFDQGFRRLLAKVLPNDRLEEIREDDALWKAVFPRPAIPLEGSKAYVEKFGKSLAPLLGIRRDGRWIVVYSPIDLCCDLEGDLIEEIVAYRKSTALPLWANILGVVFAP